VGEENEGDSEALKSVPDLPSTMLNDKFSYCPTLLEVSQFFIGDMVVAFC
jgi:hypothetical protein